MWNLNIANVGLTFVVGEGWLEDVVLLSIGVFLGFYVFLGGFIEKYIYVLDE